MKKCIIVLFAFAPIFSYAQIESGARFLGGNLSFSTFKTAGQHSTSFSINPQYGYIINEKNAIGIGAGYTGLSGTNQDTQHQYSIDVFHRYYIPITDGFFFALHSQLAFSTSRDSGIDERTNDIELSVSPKLLFFPSKHWGLEMGIDSINYTHETYSESGFKIPSTNSFSIGVAQINLGITYYFFRGL